MFFNTVDLAPTNAQHIIYTYCSTQLTVVTIWRNVNFTNQIWKSTHKSHDSKGISGNYHALMCIAENSVGPLSTRPDDVHTFLSGKTVEVSVYLFLLSLSYIAIKSNNLHWLYSEMTRLRGNPFIPCIRAKIFCVKFVDHYVFVLFTALLYKWYLYRHLFFAILLYQLANSDVDYKLLLCEPVFT